MQSVFDCTQNCAPKAAALKSAGYTAIMRYYSMNAWKRIEPGEAQATYWPVGINTPDGELILYQPQPTALLRGGSPANKSY